MPKVLSSIPSTSNQSINKPITLLPSSLGGGGRQETSTPKHHTKIRYPKKDNCCGQYLLCNLHFDKTGSKLPAAAKIKETFTSFLPFKIFPISWAFPYQLLKNVFLVIKKNPIYHCYIKLLPLSTCLDSQESVFPALQCIP